MYIYNKLSEYHTLTQKPPSLISGWTANRDGVLIAVVPAPTGEARRRFPSNKSMFKGLKKKTKKTTYHKSYLSPGNPG